MEKNLTLTTNDIVKGKVVKILPYGAILSIPNQQYGFLHISNISAKFITSINDFLKLDDIFNVKILAIDDTNKISLSIKDVVTSDFSNDTNIENTYEDNKENNSFESILSLWLKDSNEKQAEINKRAKRKY